MPNTGIPNLIATQIVAGLRVGMGWNSVQAFVSMIPVLDEGWQTVYPICQVVTSEERPYGKGRGGQEGGELLRTVDVDLVLFYRMNLDVHGESAELLTAAGTGLNDVIEQIRGIFDFTYLGYSNGLSNSTYVLMEPMFFKNKSKPVWEDEELGLAKVVLTYECNYGMYPFSGASFSLTPEQILSA